MTVHEVNFDGLTGPTHNYAGLSHGNVASMTHRGATSNPREAALQGLAKMKYLADLGLRQAVLPPHERPSLETLRGLGFGGSDADVLREAARAAPELLAACASASNMWVANAATVAPSSDTADGRVHFTPANLVAKFHRSIEPPQTARTVRAIFRDAAHFVVHAPVPGGQMFGDEGAANHTRLAPTHGQSGLHLFVHGHEALGANPAKSGPRKFASRQSLEAGAAVVRNHQLVEAATAFARQSPAAIDAGVFHNDVISVGNENVFFYHECAFAEKAVVARLCRQFEKLHPAHGLVTIQVPEDRVPLRDAVQSYLFNSQLVTVAPGRMALLAPSDCSENRRVRDFVRELVDRGDTPVQELHFLDLRQSMRNGGGPACLRLRVVLNETEIATLPPGVFLNDDTYWQLKDWIKKHYREQLTPADLPDPTLLTESRRALDELTRILGLGSIYPFQQI